MSLTSVISDSTTDLNLTSSFVFVHVRLKGQPGPKLDPDEMRTVLITHQRSPIRLSSRKGELAVHPTHMYRRSIIHPVNSPQTYDVNLVFT